MNVAPDRSPETTLPVPTDTAIVAAAAGKDQSAHGRLAPAGPESASLRGPQTHCGLVALPELSDRPDTLTAALRYIKCGFAVLPVKCGEKNPGSILGAAWPTKSTRDPQVAVSWWGGDTTKMGIALHVGRSGHRGVIVIDVDHPELLNPDTAAALVASGAPFQSTDPSDPFRGHYFFEVPEGRSFGNGTGRLGPGLDVRAGSAVVIAAPSTHTRTREGARYEIVQPGRLPVLPQSIADSLVDTSTSHEDTASNSEVKDFLRVNSTGIRPARFVKGPVTQFDGAVTAGQSRHDAMVRSCVWGFRESAAGLSSADDLDAALREHFVSAMAVAPAAGGRVLSESAATSEYEYIRAWAIGQAKGCDRYEVRRIANRGRLSPAAIEEGDGNPLTQLLDLRASWLTSDPGPDLFALAVAVSVAAHDSDPLWGMIVGPPSSGKTEAVRLDDAVADASVDELTAPALLSWSKGKNPHPVGILIRIPPESLITVGDFSTVLAGSNRGSRDMLFSLLRRVHDGSVARHLGNSEEALQWKGRCTILAAVTPTIDQYGSHADALGPRWLYYRLSEPVEADLHRSATAAPRDVNALRERAQTLAAAAVSAGRRRLASIQLSQELKEALYQAARVAAAGRGDVPREGFGQRSISGVATIEAPHRLVHQLQLLTRSLLALGLHEDIALAMARRAALDTIPRARWALMAVLATGEVMTGRGAAKEAGVNPRVGAMALEELKELGLVICPSMDGEYMEGELDREYQARRQWGDWQLSPGLGQAAAAVFNAVAGVARLAS